jgi:hypothetical protein
MFLLGMIAPLERFVWCIVIGPSREVAGEARDADEGW